MRAISDRLDLAVTIAATSGAATAGESPATVAARIAAARAAAAARWAQEGFSANADFTKGLRRLLDAGQLSPRAYGRLLRLAWTVSDLCGAGRPDRDAVDTAIELYHPRRHTS
ncbi:hypothetical protein AB0368_33335 [Actinoplanes sp. NPDC051475]|uniref:magnesium chelatase subunit ChlI family protein n=1 Tax=Actinoplanes sp. NPDC051475 TaxID=3157225 RepID=UPI00345078DE